MKPSNAAPPTSCGANISGPVTAMSDESKLPSAHNDQT
jgi:hypothetical protein